jgi:hypothetical protein
MCGRSGRQWGCGCRWETAGFGGYVIEREESGIGSRNATGEQKT